MLFLDMDLFEKAGRWLAAIFCQAIYPVITWLFDLFMTVAKVNILSVEDVQPIYQRITIILTIVMVFYVTFQFVKFVVQPDGITDKEKGVGNIVYKLIAVVVLIAFVPKIFDLAYTVQGKILDTEVISKIVFGNTTANASSFGKEFSGNIFNMFYRAEPVYADFDDQSVYKGIVAANLQNLRENNSLGGLTAGLYDTTEYTDTSGNEYNRARISFGGLFAIVVGVFIVFILVLYCIDLGVRWAQLVFLQIVAPIAIIGYLSPKKDGMFQKWGQQCLVTFLDLFLRLAIIYFALLICQILSASYANNSLFANLGEVGDTMKTFVYIVLILGLLMFVKKAPELLKELFPRTSAASGNFGLKAGDRGLNAKTFGALGRVAGAAGGAVIGAGAGLATGIGQGLRKRNALKKDGTGKKGLWGATVGATWGAIRGTVSGATRGVYNGSKKGNVLKNITAGAKNQITSNKQMGNKMESGYTLGHQIGDVARSTLGMKSRVEAQEASKAPIQRQIDALGDVQKANDSMRAEAEKKVMQGKGKLAEKYLAAEKEVRDFKEDPAKKEQYSVSKYQTDEEAYDAYVDAVKDARASVNKQNFINPDGTFNQSAYEAACDRAAKKVDPNEFKVGPYKTAEEAQEAYERDYRKAVADAKKAKDEAIEDYIDNGDVDGKKNDLIEQMRATRDAKIEAYNTSAGFDNKGNSRQINIESIPAGAKDFDDYVKKVIGGMKHEAEQEIIGIDAEIGNIKRETEGSGINEGGKK